MPRFLRDKSSTTGKKSNVEQLQTETQQPQEKEAPALSIMERDEKKHKPQGIRRPINEQKTCRVQIVLTQEERGKLDTLAKDSGRSISGYIANLVNDEYNKIVGE